MANQPVSPAKPVRERNALTKALHKREVFRQITIPLLVGGGILLICCILVVVAESANVSQLADISIIWLIVPILFFSLIFLAILAGLVYLSVLLITNLPFWSFIALKKFWMVRDIVRRITDQISSPFIGYHSYTAAAKTSVHAASRTFRGLFRPNAASERHIPK
jgi:hypothetical protein